MSVQVANGADPGVGTCLQQGCEGMSGIASAPFRIGLRIVLALRDVAVLHRDIASPLVGGDGLIGGIQCGDV